MADKPALVAEVDLMVVLGGDGTLLSVADCIGAAGVDVPILGVNFGSLGFLTEVTLPELYPSLEAALSGTARIEERMMLRVDDAARAARRSPSIIALNDVVDHQGGARADDRPVGVRRRRVRHARQGRRPDRRHADRLDRLQPRRRRTDRAAVVDALVLTPIAPHMLTNRPIVIPASSLVRVQPMMDERDEVFVTFDGQAGSNCRRATRSASAARASVRLIRPSTRSYFEVLREKLKWGER